MFGSLGAFVNGNMFAGLFGPNIGVKLDAEGLEELGAVEGSGPFGPAERPMGGYLSPAGVAPRRGGCRLGRAGAGAHRHVAAEGQEAQEVADPVGSPGAQTSASSTSSARARCGDSSPARRATASSTRASAGDSGR